MLLTFELHRDLIRKCSIFTALPADLLVPILRRLRPIIFVPRHLVIREGHSNSKLYFINRGLVHVYKVPPCSGCSAVTCGYVWFEG